ncbi:MAG: S9 family peptidase [Candidatus Acidiferrales bacterium]
MKRDTAKWMLAGCLALNFAFPAAAQKKQSTPATSAKQEKPAERAIAAMFGVRVFLETEISPDGRRVAWTESLAGKGGAPSPNSAIFIADVAKPDAPRKITAGNGTAAHEEHDIAWAPESQRVAFLSDAETPGQLQLFVASAAGGAARRLTHLHGFVTTPGWSPDGKTIALLYTENATRAAGPLVAETPVEGVVTDASFEQRLTLVDAETGHTRQISPADMYVYEYDWSPDGKRFITTAAHGNGDDNWYVAEIFTINGAGGAMKSIYKPPLQIGVPKWSADGKLIAFIGGLMSDEPVVGGDVYVVPAEGGAARNLTEGMKATASWLEWTPDSKIEFTEHVDGNSGIASVDLEGNLSTRWTRPESIGSPGFGFQISLARDGKMSAVIRHSFEKPPEVWAGPVGAWQQVTHANATLEPAWGGAKSLHWTSDNFTIQGWLLYPRDFDPAKKYPMVVYVHGGPSSSVRPAWPLRWDYAEALAEAGYFVLRPNPRGSYGQGETFTQANVKDFGYGDFRDILAGVDAAEKIAPIDDHRVGITGWSYGGYMTMWAVTQTNRFRAAVSGAGLADWLSYYGENEIDQWMIPFFGASVYDDPAVYEKSAPIHFIKNARTPTLIVVGDRDGECPAPQSFEFWHALKTLGVQTQFVVYPSEGHLFANPAHSRDVIERTLEWFNRLMPPE